jgi:hypothetical protein
VGELLWQRKGRPDITYTAHGVMAAAGNGMMGNKRHIDEMAFVRDVQILHCQVNPAY